MKSTDSSSTEDLATIVHRGSPKPFRKWAVILILLALVIGGALYFREKNSEEEGKPTYVTEPVKRGDLSLGITATGNLQPTNKVSVSSELSGITEAVYVDRNDQVKKGQPLVKLDTRKLDQQTAKLRATRDSAKARVSQVEATVRESSANLARLNELHKLSGGRTPSTAELETAAATVDRAKADLDSAVAASAGAEADLLAIESDLSKAIIRSPVDGIVLTRSIEIGQTLAASFNAPELFVIAEDLRKMKLLVAIAEADSGQVKDGQSAIFNVDASPNRPYSAKVKIVSYGSAILDNVVTYQAELEVSNDDLTLRPGMTATATIDVAKAENVLLVPATALRFKPPVEEATGAAAPKKTFMQSITFQMPRRAGQRPGGAGGGGGPGGKGKGGHGKSEATDRGHVWVLQDGKPVEVSVKLGLSDGRQTQIITDKLKEDDQIVIRQVMPPTP
jgi:HlyD family secretion protein